MNTKLQTTPELPSHIVSKAKSFYMAGVSAPVIHKLTGIPREQLDTLIMGQDGLGTERGCWNAERFATVDEVVVAASIERLDFSLRCTGIASAVLHDSLSQLHMQMKDGGRSLTVKEMESVASIIEKLDKIVRLEKGSPTEIISKAGLSVEEAKRIIMSDPFAPKTVEAEVISVVTPEEDILG